jgi:predicted acyltransferase
MQGLSNVNKTNASFLNNRLVSLDVLRGFDMFWIIGADDIVHGMAKMTKTSFWENFSFQLSHPQWNGFTMYDLIFPLFIFLAGVSTPFSIGKALEEGNSKEKLLIRVFQRGIILIILGIIYNNGLTLKPLEEIRFSSVLGRIGITYIFANIIYLYVKPRWFLFWFAGLLLSYYFLLKFFSAPNFEAGDLTMEGNFASYIDRLLLPGKLSLKIHDTVGFFNNIPAISNSLAGIMVGIFIKRNEFSGIKKTLYLAGLGLLSLLLAQLWNVDFPINKNLWSSSFVLQTVGLSLLLFSLFYYIIDVLGYQKWSVFFRVIGVNAILIYMSVKFIDWNFTARKFFEWSYQWVGDSWSMLMIPISILIIKWLFLRILYHYKIFLRI